MPGEKKRDADVRERYCFTLTLAIACLAASQGASSPAAAAGPETPTARVPLMSDQEAWKRLPAVESGGGGRLPAWAKALASSLPQTTAAVLDLDRIYRTSDSLDPRLAGAIRLVVARKIRSDYGRAYARG